MNIKHILIFWIFCIPIVLKGQGNCSNPITLSSVVVSNTQCGAATGTIILTPEGALGLYSYEWTPQVSLSNVATLLPAGTYNIHIERINNPVCTLDTLVLVNNSNGPQVQASISPAQCLANNGSISLTPTNLLYNWSHGPAGATVTGLESKNYFVTVTNPNNGCFSIFKYFVPRNLNSLNVSALVQDNAKCGMNNGRAQVLVSGGSGQYAYTPGPGPQYNNLAPNNYTIQVLDLATGCTGLTNFTIENLPVTGTVNLTTNDPRCSGQATGFVDFEVIGGTNFEMPFVFTLKDAQGNDQSPGSLLGGTYTLQIADADGCTLPAQNFIINEPPPFIAQTQVSPETCMEGGQIALSISGGNGPPYLVDWADLPGNDNPKDRLNLQAGRYSATVFDSLFCSYMVDTVLVEPNCDRNQTVHMVLGINSSDSHCVPPPPGFGNADANYTLLGGGLAGASSFGTWTLGPNGCLFYSAGFSPGFGVDTICILRSVPQIGLQDTTCVVVSITQQAPTKQTVFFSMLVEASSTACGTIPPSFTNISIVQLGRPGLMGTSDAYGVYNIDDSNACVAFFANNATGFNVDEIRVAVYDLPTNRCHIITYFPTILPKTDCSTVLNLPDAIQLIIMDCDELATTCLPIPFDEIVSYTVIDNGALYSEGYAGCSEDTIARYNLAALPIGGGPYELTEWTVNGQVFTGNFLNFNGLVELMNQLDASSNAWRAQGTFIRGGSKTSTYGLMRIKSVTGNTAVFAASLVVAPLGTELRFAPGLHQLSVRNTTNACSDTMFVEVLCFDCAPIHSYPFDAFGRVKWSVSSCNTDTVFCTNIPNLSLGEYIVTDNGQSFLDFTLCGNFVGMNLDTGFHVLHFLNTTTTCEWTVPVLLECKEVLNTETIPVTVPLGGMVSVCLDTSYLSSPLVSIVNLCDEEGSDIIGYSYNLQNWCVQISGTNLGADTMCIQLCNNQGECADYILLVNVSDMPSDSVLTVFKGISPNGDGRNDTWSIPGIEQFPNNTVQVFNRWGNLVFEQKGYSNADPWDGQWNGKDLPDGTYFYRIELGGDAEILSGWLQILR